MLVNDKNTETGRQIFFVCLTFFLLLQAYGIYFSDLRLQSDASDDFIRYSAAGTFLPPQPVFFRYAYVLNKFLLKPAFLLHLPVTIIAKIYCVNDALFYLLVAALIIWLTRKYVYAAVVLAAPVLIHDCNFYFIFNELYLSGSLMVLYVAVYQYMAPGRSKTALLAVCVFFIIFSHPVMLLVLGVFMAGTFSSYAQVLQSKRWLLFIFAIAIVRLLLLSNYDYHRLSKPGVQVTTAYFFETCRDYCRVFWYIPLLGIYCAYDAVKYKKQKAIYGVLLLTPVLLFVCALHKIRVHEIDFSKYLYPVNLFVLTTGMVVLTERPAQRNWLPAGAFGILAAAIIVLIMNFHNRFLGRTVLLRNLIAACAAQGPGYSKWYVNSDSVIALDPMITGINSESILFSALDNQNPIIQICRVSNQEQPMVRALATDSFFINGLAAIPVQRLNPYYFNFKQGPYKQLVWPGTAP